MGFSRHVIGPANLIGERLRATVVIMAARSFGTAKRGGKSPQFSDALEQGNPPFARRARPGRWGCAVSRA
jgi:hypothetical protein